jgi:hypothetical protein
LKENGIVRDSGQKVTDFAGFRKATNPGGFHSVAVQQSIFLSLECHIINSYFIKHK